MLQKFLFLSPFLDEEEKNFLFHIIIIYRGLLQYFLLLLIILKFYLINFVLNYSNLDEKCEISLYRVPNNSFYQLQLFQVLFQMVQFGDMFLGQQEAIACKLLMVYNHKIACFQLFDKIGICSLLDERNSLANQTHISLPMRS